MRVKCIKAASVMLLMAGYIFLSDVTGGTSPETGAGRTVSGQKFRVVVVTPGTGQNQTAGNRSHSESAEGASADPRPLPNYQGETLTLGLLGR